MEGTAALRERFESIYTAALADILDTRGYRTQTLPPSIRPLERGMKLAGPAFTVRGKPSQTATYDTSLRKVLKMLGEVPAGHVAVYACGQDVAAHLGELSVTSLAARDVAGCVLDGGCRDVSFIVELGFPVFCAHVTPEDSTFRWELEATQEPVSVGQVRIDPGDWVVGDGDGVTVVPGDALDAVLAAARRRAAKERGYFEALRSGDTTVRLLGLDPSPVEREA